MLDYHVILDLLPTLAALYFSGRFPADVKLSGVQSCILLALGLQRKPIEAIEVRFPLSPLATLTDGSVTDGALPPRRSGPRTIRQDDPQDDSLSLRSPKGFRSSHPPLYLGPHHQDLSNLCRSSQYSRRREGYRRGVEGGRR
jgi:hypothetical protein